MPVITILLEDELHRRLKLRAAGANLSISAFLRPLIEDAAFPGGRYVYTGQDEILGVAVQTFAIVTELASAQSPEVLERAAGNARRLLRERGLTGSDRDGFSHAGSNPDRRGEFGR